MSVSESSAKPGSRLGRKNFYVAGCFIAMAVYTAIVAADVLMPGSFVWAAIAAAFVSIVFAFLWARALDEVALQAHYVSWYWGGTLGLGLAALCLVALMPDLMQGAMPLRLPFLNEPAGAFLGGYMFGLMPPAIGYLIWWAIYWMRHR